MPYKPFFCTFESRVRTGSTKIISPPTTSYLRQLADNSAQECRKYSNKANNAYQRLFIYIQMKKCVLCVLKMTKLHI